MPSFQLVSEPLICCHYNFIIQIKKSSELKIQSHLDKKSSHILVVLFPLQGHAAPLIKLSYKLANLGVNTTLMVTESMGSTLASSIQSGVDQIKIFCFPDGLEPDDDRKDAKKLYDTLLVTLGAHLQDFVEKAKSCNNKVTGVIFDTSLLRLVDVPKEMGIKTAVYWCSSPGCMALLSSIPRLLEANFIDEDGIALKNEKIPLLPNMPAMSSKEFSWYVPGSVDAQKYMFHFTKVFPLFLKSSDFVICNWIHELDTSACKIAPNILSVGPLLADEGSAGSLYSEDSTCLSWLDQQPPGSVVYVAFGSTSKFCQQQIDEIAMGLEITNRPFLWVAWSGLLDGSSLTYPVGFCDRVGNRGKIVEWAPQEKVLAHPSVACFLSHCGWNSTMESISNGVPLLCWPYFGDQLYTQTCICEAWKVGFSLEAAENGMILKDEIKQKIDNLLSDSSIKRNAMNLKERARKSISRGGSSYQNLEYLAAQMSNERSF